MANIMFPATAICANNVIAGIPLSDFVSKYFFNYGMPANTLGGYGDGLLDINDYNGSKSGTSNRPSILISETEALTSLGISDHMQTIYTNPGSPWYLMRQTDFKDWVGLAGVFWRNTSFVMEIDVAASSLPTFGGFRDEAPNLSLKNNGYAEDNSHLDPRGLPYSATGLQGSGIMLKAIVTDQATLLEVVKDSFALSSPQGWIGDYGTPPSISLPRQTVSLHLDNVTPEEMATMVLRIESQNYTKSYAYDFPAHDFASHADVNSTIYRIGLRASEAGLRSSGKLSAAMTSR